MTLFIAFYALNEKETFPRFAHRVSGTCAMCSSLHRNQKLFHLHHYWLPHFGQSPLWPKKAQNDPKIA